MPRLHNLDALLAKPARDLARRRRVAVIGIRAFGRHPASGNESRSILALETGDCGIGRLGGVRLAHPSKLVQYLETVKALAHFFLTAPPAAPCYPRPSMPPLLLALALLAALAPPAPAHHRPAPGQVRQR